MAECPDCGGIGIGGSNAPYSGSNWGTNADYSGMEVCQTCGGTGEVSNSSETDSESANDSEAKSDLK